jgi:ribosomal protein S27E
MSDLDLIKEDVERYYKEQNNKGYSMVNHARSSPLFSFETLLKFAAMYHATKRMEEHTSEEPALNIDLVSNTMLNTKCNKCNHVFELKYSDDSSQLDTLQIGVGRDADVYNVDVECPKCGNNETVY